MLIFSYLSILVIVTYTLTLVAGLAGLRWQQLTAR